MLIYARNMCIIISGEYIRDREIDVHLPPSQVPGDLAYPRAPDLHQKAPISRGFFMSGICHLLGLLIPCPDNVLRASKAKAVLSIPP